MLKLFLLKLVDLFLIGMGVYGAELCFVFFFYPGLAYSFFFCVRVCGAEISIGRLGRSVQGELGISKGEVR